MDQKIFDLIIVGGGAAGLIAAISAKSKFKNVLLLEKEDKVGEKLKKTGNGRCNLTNLVQSPKFYHSDKELFTVHVLDHFSIRKTIQFFNELGIFTENINDYIYPYTQEAKTVVDVLRNKFLNLGGMIKCKEEVKTTIKENEIFIVTTDSWKYYGHRLLLTTGSSAFLKESSTCGYHLAKNLGHKLTPLLPTLVPLLSNDSSLYTLAGLRHKGRVTYLRDEENILSHEGEIQFINGGISGIPIFQVSGDVIQDLYIQKEVILYLNFLPDFDRESLLLFWEHRKNVLGDETLLGEFLKGLIHQKLIKVILEKNGIASNLQLKDLSKEQEIRLLDLISNFPININSHKDLSQSHAARGGVTTYEINSITLESKLVDNLYFAGEILDVDGLCGGYNLQWAWSSGYIAGQCLKEEDYD